MKPATAILSKHKHTAGYAAALALLLFVLKWVELKLVIIDHAFELYIAFIALFFTILGGWLAVKLAKPKVRTVVVEKPVYINNTGGFRPNEDAIEHLGLSKREIEVLELLAGGLSNREIAEKLFVSGNTVKTHLSRLFSKLDVGRRTQAVDKAKKMGIIP